MKAPSKENTILLQQVVNHKESKRPGMCIPLRVEGLSLQYLKERQQEFWAGQWDRKKLNNILPHLSWVYTVLRIGLFQIL